MVLSRVLHNYLKVHFGYSVENELEGEEQK